MREKILFYIDHVAYGGAQRAMSTLVNGLADREYTVILVNDIQMEKEEFPIDMRVKRLNLNCPHRYYRILNNIKRMTILRKMISDEAPDLVVSFLGGPNIRMLVGTIGLKVFKIVSVRNDPNYEYGNKPIKKILINKLFSTANGVVFQTNDASKYFSEKIVNRSCVILNPVSPSFYTDSSRNCKKDVNRILFVGRLVPQKNVEIIIHSFAKVRNNHPECILQICGDGPLRESLEKLVDSLNLTDVVTFLGRSNDVKNYLKMADIFVMASNYEGLPNALMEAMAMGLPCISTDCPCGGPRELAKTGEEVFLIPVGDEEKLTIAMKTLIEEPEKRELLSKKGKARAKDFQVDVVCDKWESYISKVINRQRNN